MLADAAHTSPVRGRAGTGVTTETQATALTNEREAVLSCMTKLMDPPARRRGEAVLPVSLHRKVGQEPGALLSPARPYRCRQGSKQTTWPAGQSEGGEGTSILGAA